MNASGAGLAKKAAPGRRSVCSGTGTAETKQRNCPGKQCPKKHSEKHNEKSIYIIKERWQKDCCSSPLFTLL